MRILSFLILICLITVFQDIKSPHGSDFRVSCSVCHSTKGWYLDREVYSFNHDKTSFLLTGQHSLADCRSCHKSLIFSEAPSACFVCHADVHQQTAGNDCGRCHTTGSWLVSDITGIHRNSRFPLLGAHRTADCSMCHKSENPVRFDVLGIECIDCHRNDFKSATNPSHVLSDYSEDCSQCHDLNSYQWQGAGLNHDFFPLTIGHGSLTCASCHSNKPYQSASPECSSCHLEDYNSSTNPAHRSQNFPLKCTECHTTNPGWKPAMFEHTSFPLTQGHSSLTCISCHKTNNYSDAKSECSACHLQDYSSTTNPIHKTLNFSLSCTECHTTNPDWKPAQYTQHDSQSFPIYSGQHRGEWSSCTDCHNQTSNYSIFTCISCHAHSSKSNVDGDHSGVRDYVYSATSCYTCHKTGRAE